jgi:6-phosphogluconolactonase (cycloisomerase 2 family)
MKRSLQFLAFLSFALVASSALSQAVAYVYVAHNPKNSSTNEISAWSVAANGKLTPISGSPFREDVDAMAVDGGHLVAVNRSQPNLDTFVIENGGALRYEASSNYAKYSVNDNCPIANQIFFDHTGATLYVQEFNADCANTGVASFALNKQTGKLRYLGINITGVFPGDNNAAYFIGNNVYAYTAVNSDCMYYGIYGFKRNANGLLISGGALNNYPTPSPSFRRFVPQLLAADPKNHLAMLMQPANPPGCVALPPQLATYTVSSSGVLSTTSKYWNMPSTKIADPYDMKMSPSGKLLAVAGKQGLQIFHFNGENPITIDDKTPLTTDPVDQIFWDNRDHLYAISQSTGKLRVYTITPSSIQLAPGSPHPINSPEYLIVQPVAHR